VRSPNGRVEEVEVVVRRRERGREGCEESWRKEGRRKEEKEGFYSQVK